MEAKQEPVGGVSGVVPVEALVEGRDIVEEDGYGFRQQVKEQGLSLCFLQIGK